MIALCLIHAAAADGGAFTKDQLRDYKKKQYSDEDVTGQFHWKRKSFLVRLGTNYTSGPGRALSVNGTPIIWFDGNRQVLTLSFVLYDAEGNLVLEQANPLGG
jgi:hypothetical protein